MLTFNPAELITASYQRRKGRDLFAPWLALTGRWASTPTTRLRRPYRPDGYSNATALANLEGHVADRVLREDLTDLVAE